MQTKKQPDDKAMVAIGRALHAELRIVAAATPGTTIREIVMDACYAWLKRRSKKTK